ncbi:hypothetical protein [uncultured Aquimarina sp.]|nr:hypothetical protein [uncultured Aquimarina sp.]
MNKIQESLNYYLDTDSTYTDFTEKGLTIQKQLTKKEENTLNLAK